MHGPDDPDAVLPGIVNVGFPGCSAEAMLLLLDAAGIDCSTGAACSAGRRAAQPRAAWRMGLSEADGPLVAAVSRSASTSTLADVDALAAALLTQCGGPRRLSG